MCYGKTGGEYPIALICPNRAKIMELGTQLKLEGDFAKLCEEQKVREAVTKSCMEGCKASNLKDFEIPKKIGLVSDTWTVENEMLTAAMKLKRPVIVEKHQELIDKLYAP